ncbi:DUF1353 domain-containing protein [Ruania alba]|uniref:DUF1353 domain-containing protein n=1 Tax=Ruania alba TaxID=648782 RepID=A0A1H5FBY0_9MICO|nr:DUF1353 domain-containing protein [Ruania alba]SEE00843.1 Protein of unknown function [Ruania alba]
MASHRCSLPGCPAGYEVGEFFDPASDGPSRLEVRSIDGRQFSLLRPIGYRSDDYPEPFQVPGDLTSFRTDFASVPWMFTWLVPRSGRYTPAAVLHDALVVPGDYLGPPVDRVEADRIFRAALRDTGTPVVRSWLMWAAVSIATKWNAGTHRAAHRAVVIAFISVITILGIVATGDLLDLWSVLPWMGEHSFGAELARGAAAAVVIPAALSLSWGRLALAGTITGIALAFLVHITVAIAVVFSLYRIVERIVSGLPGD